MGAESKDGAGEESERKKLPGIAKYLLYGAVSGAVSRTGTAPIERVKIMFQVDTMGKRDRMTSVGVVRRIFREEGALSFWKGNGVNVLRIVPSSAARFYAYEHYKQLLGPHVSNDFVLRLYGGALAGVTAMVATYPLDLLRSQLSAHTGTESLGMATLIRRLYAKEGVRGFYRGMLTACLGIGPYVAINFSSYETLRAWSDARHGAQGALGGVWMGAIAGALSVALTYPTDVVKRRMMIQGLDGRPQRYTGIMHAVRDIRASEGMRGYYRGFSACMFKVLPSNALQWATMELCRDFFGR